MYLRLWLVRSDIDVVMELLLRYYGRITTEEPCETSLADVLLVKQRRVTGIGII